MGLVKAYLEIYQDPVKRKRFFRKYFPQGKVDSNFLFSDSKEKNDNLRQFLQDLITHSGLLTSDQDFILLPKKLSNNWYKSYKLLDWLKQGFNPSYSYKVLFFCWPEKMIEPDDSTQPHWHVYDFHTSKYPRENKSLNILIQYVRHIYSNFHWRIGPKDQIALVGGYTFENLFSTANEKKGFDNLTEELDLESIYKQVCGGNVSEFARIFFPEIDFQMQIKKSKSTTEHCFYLPTFTHKTLKMRKYLLTNRHFFAKDIVKEINSSLIGFALLTKQWGGIYTPQGLWRIFPLGEKPSDNRHVSIRKASLIIPDKILAQNILEAGKIALDRNYNLTQLSLEELQSWVTGVYYRELLNPPELIFRRPANLQGLPKNEWEEMMVALVLKAQSGDKIAEGIVCQEYQRIVWDIALKYHCPGQNTHDLSQHGNMGLLEAIYDFDKTKNCVFTPFVIMCIKRRIFDLIRSARTIKRKASNEALYLDNSIDYDSDKTYLYLLESDRTDNPLAQIIIGESSQLSEKLLSKLFKILSPREMDVLIQLIIADSKRKPLAQIAKKLGLTPKSIENARTRIKAKIEGKIFPLFPHLATLIRS